ncbi:Glutathione S-transferase [Bosea sp. OK403]|jgi:glutathione S-transferase|uniref:glutathione S-transferase family protein n=1 Tax=Bosea sp. OK403 TaxID=1855286 RepID=UPI0008F0F813|nr:glutathione S-transferase [Bosea sp. OK403]SFJ92413.1 Glutathione S-transferase [Bosea sp. OK403]
MKLYQSTTSPFVRKVRIAAAELGLIGQIEMLDVSQEFKTGGPTAREANIVKSNPLGQVPTLLTDDGIAIADSRVICEYLNHRAGGEIFPSDPAKRWTALMDQTVGDGLLDAALLARYEGFLRPEEKRWDKWSEGQMTKVRAVLAVIEAKAAEFGDRLDIGTITFASGLAYLDLRFGDLGWRDGHPETAAWFARIEQRPAFAQQKLG